MSDAQLNELGLTAIGDILTLRNYCSERDEERDCNADSAPQYPGTSDGAETQVQKRRKLLKLLLSGNKKSDPAKKAAGRPPAEKKKVTAGLRLSRPQGGNKPYIQLKSPLGDANTIALAVSMNATYEEVLEVMRSAFFPENVSPVLGDANYYTMAVVNTGNDIIEGALDCSFTIRAYLSKKMIAGSLRLHLLCTTNKHEVELEDDLGNIDHIEEVTCYESDRDTLPLGGDDCVPDVSAQQQEQQQQQDLIQTAHGIQQFPTTSSVVGTFALLEGDVEGVSCPSQSGTPTVYFKIEYLFLLAI